MALQGLALVVLHALPTGLDPTIHFVSGYANEPFTWVLHVGQLGRFVGMLALIAALWSARLAPGWSVAFICLTIAVAMMPIGFLFPMDPVETAFDAEGAPRFSTTGWIHAISGMIGAVALMLGMLSVTIRLFRSHRIRGGFWGLILAGVLAPVFYAAVIATIPGTFPSGLYQRAFIVCIWIWPVVTSCGLISGALTTSPHVVEQRQTL